MNNNKSKVLSIAGIFLLAICGVFINLINPTEQSVDSNYSNEFSKELTFRNADLRNEHYQKHGVEMGFSSASDYEAAAVHVVQNSDSLHKLEAEDGDDVYYLERTNEFVIVSTDGYIRTYFKPHDGIDYFNRQ
ncbi:MAG: hypothetical protein ACI4EK_00635 [Wujia sp.]